MKPHRRLQRRWQRILTPAYVCRTNHKKSNRLRLIAEGKIPSGEGTSPRVTVHPPDISNMVRLLPKFNEKDPDIFFSLFENVADDRGWTDGERTLLLQSVFVGKAQEAFIALPGSDRKVYTKVKDAVLKAYELVPEAYRIRFRNWEKREKQTYMEVARELKGHFNRWCTAGGVSTFEELTSLIVLEQFRNILPDRIATYINEHKVKTAAEASVLADEFVLIHKHSFRERSFGRRHGEQRFGQSSHYSVYQSSPPSSPSHGRVDLNASQLQVSSESVNRNVGPSGPSTLSSRDREDPTICHYCLDKGHWKKDCPVLKGKNHKGKSSNAKFAGLAVSGAHALSKVSTAEIRPKPEVVVASSDQRVSAVGSSLDSNTGGPVETCQMEYSPFISDGLVSLVGSPVKVLVKIL